jgi:hypothetical protein
MGAAAALLALAFGVAGCYVGPGYPAYGGYGYDYSPGYYYAAPAVSGSFFFGDFGHHGDYHHHHGW